MSPLIGPTKDQRVRQALGKLFDRPALIRDVLFGAGWVSTGIFLPGLDWHMSEADINKVVGYNVTEAKQLFSAAGFDPASWKPVLDSGIPTPTSTDPTTEVYISTLKQAGIDATVHKVDKVEITDKIWLRADTEFCICNKPTFSGANGELYFFYHSSGRFAAPYKQLGDAQLDRLIDSQAAELRSEQRKAILMDVQKRILETAIVMPIYSRTNGEAIQPKLRGYQNDPNEPHRYAEAWFAA
jgi:ABC-type transport system substrate-binding protein